MASGLDKLSAVLKGEIRRTEARCGELAELIPRQIADAVERGASYDATHLLGALNGDAMAVGSAHRDVFQSLTSAVADHLQSLDRDNQMVYAPWLSNMAVMNLLQIMGLEVDPDAVRHAADGLPYLATTRVEPPSYDWSKGIAALALDRPIVYRNVAALPVDGAAAFDASVAPEYNAQGWLAQFAAAVEHGASAEEGHALWRQFLPYYLTLVDMGAITDYDLTWVARVVHDRIARQPLETVADWMAEDLRAALGV
ncbi:MAG: hypothetical protein AAGK37_11095 [Pseudomonadota bacterium]